MIDTVWPKVAHIIEPAINREQINHWTLPMLYQHIRKGEALLWLDKWPDPGNAMISTFQQWNGEPVAVIMYLAGDGGMDWPSMIRAFKVWAERCGAVRTYINGRKGWERVLGARIVSVQYVIED